MKQKDVDQMLAAGLITSDQASAITAHFRLNESRAGRWLLFILASLSSALILGGIIMIISANWDEIPNLVKMIAGMLIMVSFWVAWYKLKERMPMVAESMGLAGGGMWLANIALYGQIFQLQNPFVEGCALFFTGIVLLPFLAKQRLLYGVVIVTSFILFVAATQCHTSPLHLPIDDETTCAFVLLMGLGWWLASERCRTAKGAAKSYAWVNIPLSLVLIFLLQLFLLYPIATHGEVINTYPLIGVPIVMFFCKPKGANTQAWIALTVFTLIAAFIGLNKTGDERFAIFYIFIGFIYALIWMRNGWLAKRVDWINYGAILIFFTGIATFANIMETLTGSGITLIISGLILLSLTVMLEKQRRHLIASIKSSTQA